MELISIIGNVLHIYMLAFSEPNSIRSRLMVYCKWLRSSALALNIINNSCRVFISQSGSQASYTKMTARFDGCQVRARCLQRSDCIILVTAAFVTNLARSIPTSYLCHMSIRFHQSHSNELMGKCSNKTDHVARSRYFWSQKYCYWYQRNWLLGIVSVVNFAVLHTLRVRSVAAIIYKPAAAACLFHNQTLVGCSFRLPLQKKRPPIGPTVWSFSRWTCLIWHLESRH